MERYKLLFESLDSLDLKDKYIVNDNYNKNYITKKNILNSSWVTPQDIQTNSKNKIFSTPFATVWLLNLDRLIINSKINCKEYNFVDVGCGKGISSIYILDNYDFKSVNGFDFSPTFIKDAVNNLKNCNIEKKEGINFSIGDASNYLMNLEKTYFHLFNPFENNILKLFIKNNINNIKKTHSIITIINDKSKNILLDYKPVKVVSLDDYNSTIYFF